MHILPNKCDSSGPDAACCAAEATHYRRWGKRALDLVIAAPLLLALLPVVAVVWLCVRWTQGSPALFHQRRPGKNGKIFTVHKFRTMTNAKEPDGSLSADEKRLSRFGKFLRSTSLDEIPQLYNVIRGEMSLVGPRPLLVEYLDHYTPTQMRRHAVRPGITGWAQVNGRNNTTWDDRLEQDCWYVDNHGLLLDLKILWKTLAKAIWPSGISHPTSATMPRFDAVKTTQNDVLVLCGGGHCKVVISTLKLLKKNVVGILDDDQEKWQTSVLGVPILGPLSEHHRWPAALTVLAIGDNEARRMLSKNLKRNWMTLIHPTAYVDASAKIGAGCMILQGAIVQADANIGDHSIVNTGASVDHDCVVSEYCHVGPGSTMGGGVHLQPGVFLGCGATAIPNVVVGRDTIVGAGATVVHNLPSNVVAVGVPARVLRENIREAKAA